MEKAKILIIDDEEGFTKLVKLNLELTGKYEVRVENKGEKGLIAAKVPVTMAYADDGKGHLDIVSLTAAE